jgi:tetratricopeptide (TPR) repeat protein
MAVVVHGTVAGQHEVALRACAEALALETPGWPARLRWLGAFCRAYRHALCGEPDALLTVNVQALDLARQAGSALQYDCCLGNQGDALMMCGRLDEAIQIARELIARLSGGSRPESLNMAQINLAAALTATGALEEAAQAATAAIPLAWRLGRAAYLLDHLSSLAARIGRHQESLLMVGYANTWWASIQYTREGNEAAAVRQALAWGTQALGQEEAARLVAKGALLDAGQARRLAEAVVQGAGDAQQVA